MNERMLIRPERPDDVDAIRRVNQAAFAGDAEADLVEALRVRAHPVISLVAEDAGEIRGHILFSPVTLSSEPALRLAGLAPMAVLPAYQRTGIGSSLVRAGLEVCRRRDFVAVVVLGHPAYYPRFGFEPASRFGMASDYDVADDTFMLLELQTGGLRGKSGTIHYHPAFGEI